MTNHMWDGFWFLANGKTLERRCRPTCSDVDRQEPQRRPRSTQREDIAKQNDDASRRT